MITKLQHYGIRGQALLWFQSYLQNRLQYVKYLSALSPKIIVPCGVPQGSILGPLLFIIYTNDIANLVDNHHAILYADDTTLLFKDNDYTSLTSKINEALCKIHLWFSVNKLSLNTEKTTYIIFGQRRLINESSLNIKINNNMIDRSSDTKFLGVYLEENMSWKIHIMHKANHIAKINGIMCKLKNQIPTDVLRTIYNSLVLPQLNYGISAWGNVKNRELNRLKTLQKKSIRIISNSKFLSHTGPLFKKMRLLTIDDLFQLNCCKIYHKYIKGLLPNYFSNKFHLINEIHNYNTRNENRLYTANITCEISKQSLNYKVTSSWNKSPALVQQKQYLSIESFNKFMKSYLISKYPDACYHPECYVCNNTRN